jgi:hypothetical protein
MRMLLTKPLCYELNVYEGAAAKECRAKFLEQHPSAPDPLQTFSS